LCLESFLLCGKVLIDRAERGEERRFSRSRLELQEHQRKGKKVIAIEEIEGREMEGKSLLTN